MNTHDNGYVPATQPTIDPMTIDSAISALSEIELQELDDLAQVILIKLGIAREPSLQQEL